MTPCSRRHSPVSPALIVGLFLASGAALASGPDGRHRPPPAALEACADQTTGDSCALDTPAGREAGSCLRPPDAPHDAPLACVPEGAPRMAPGGPPRDGPPPEAVAACASAAAEEGCEVETPAGLLAGSCLRPPDAADAPLACVPDGAPPPGARR